MNKCEWKNGVFIGCDKARAIHGDPMTMLTYGTPWAYCPHCGADIRKPVEIKVGQFGHFWDDSESERGAWGVLHIPSDGSEYPYCKVSVWYKHFTPGLPTGFNMDGTPKEED